MKRCQKAGRFAGQFRIVWIRMTVYSERKIVKLGAKVFTGGQNTVGNKAPVYLQFAFRTDWKMNMSLRMVFYICKLLFSVIKLRFWDNEICLSLDGVGLSGQNIHGRNARSCHSGKSGRHRRKSHYV